MNLPVLLSFRFRLGGTLKPKLGWALTPSEKLSLNMILFNPIVPKPPK